MSINTETMHELATELFPICRSITGKGVRTTLQRLKEIIPLTVFSVPSGTRAFDWTVPNEWNVDEAYIANSKGEKIVDYKNNNLHLVGYSSPVDKIVNLDELNRHLHSLEEQPDAIPYVTSYYKENWGFCMTHNSRLKLIDQDYRVIIKSSLKPGVLNYGEYIIPGELEDEIFFSTYICHPSMANNELSGPVVATYLASWIASMPRKYTYRFIFIPETIGAIVYLSKHLDSLQKKMQAGFNLTCLGDERTYSIVRSRYGNTYADKLAENSLRFQYPEFKDYNFLARGSDERQYSSPGIDLPLVTLCRSKFGEYPEYHTSLDDLALVTQKGLEGSLELLKTIVNTIENNQVFQTKCLCEPQLGKRGLYPVMSKKGSVNAVRDLMNFIAYADGTNDLIDISNLINCPVSHLLKLAGPLLKEDLIESKPI